VWTLSDFGNITSLSNWEEEEEGGWQSRRLRPPWMGLTTLFIFMVFLHTERARNWRTHTFCGLAEGFSVPSIRIREREHIGLQASDSFITAGRLFRATEWST
jgi:hypothetical protein